MGIQRTLLVSAVLLSVCLSVQAWFLTKKTENKDAIGEVSQACLDKADAGDCEFYSCFNSRFLCEHNYAIKYGHRFCNRFKDNIQLFTPVAQRWVNNTRTCAMRRLKEYYKKDSIECYDFHHRAEHIYSACARTNGVCSVSMMWSNREALRNVYLKNFRSSAREAIKRVYMMFKDCSKLQIAKILFWLLAKIGQTPSF